MQINGTRRVLALWFTVPTRRYTEWGIVSYSVRILPANEPLNSQSRCFNKHMLFGPFSRPAVKLNVLDDSRFGWI